MNDIVLQTRKVWRTYDTASEPFHALADVDIKAYAGEILMIRGRSGSGKTTLLNLLAGLEPPSSGEVFLKGINISRVTQTHRDKIRRNEIGMVFQSSALFPFMTALENVELALRLNEMPIHNLRETAMELIHFVGLETRMAHYPDELSGGEQQRIAVARAVIRSPSILLADEPTAMLDSKMSLTIMELFSKLAKDRGICVVMTNHNPLLLDFADRSYILDNGRVLHDDAN